MFFIFYQLLETAKMSTKNPPARFNRKVDDGKLFIK